MRREGLDARPAGEAGVDQLARDPSLLAHPREVVGVLERRDAELLLQGPEPVVGQLPLELVDEGRLGQQVADPHASHAVGEREGPTDHHVGVASDQRRDVVVLARVDVLDVGLVDPKARLGKALEQGDQLVAGDEHVARRVVGARQVDHAVAPLEPTLEPADVEAKVVAGIEGQQVDMHAAFAGLARHLRVGEARRDDREPGAADRVAKQPPRRGHDHPLEQVGDRELEDRPGPAVEKHVLGRDLIDASDGLAQRRVVGRRVVAQVGALGEATKHVEALLRRVGAIVEPEVERELNSGRQVGAVLHARWSSALSAGA